MLIILSLIMILKRDNYVYQFIIKDDRFQIDYQENFNDNIKKSFLINTKTIKSINFHSKFMLDSFHTVTIRYIDDNGLHFEKGFKIDTNDKFIDLKQYLTNCVSLKK